MTQADTEGAALLLRLFTLTAWYCSGASPAYYAAQEGRLEVLEFLCEKCKCDMSVPCNDGLKPIHAASQCGHTKIVKVYRNQTCQSCC